MIVIVLKQNITYQIMCEIWDKVLTSHTCQKRLWDLSHFSGSFSQDELIEFAKYANNSQLEKSFSAMVAPTDLLYGVMRQHKVYRERDENTVVNVFRDFEEARNWLASV